MKRAVIVLCIILALLAAELGREYIGYRMESNRLEGGYWRLQGRTSMTKDEVRRILGEPDAVLPAASEENWYWMARVHRGPLLRLLMPGEGYVLNAQFDEEGRLIDVYSSLNMVAR